MTRTIVHTLDDGSSITADEIMEIAGITRGCANKRLQKTKNREELLAPPVRRYELVYSRDGLSYTTREIMGKVGLPHGTASARARQWERGEISTEQLFWPKRKRPKDSWGDERNRGNAEWQALSNKPRDDLIDSVGDIGKWERKQLKKLELKGNQG